MIVLDNHVTAMTGFQPSPRASIEDAVSGLGVKEVVSVDPADEPAALEALRKAKAGKGTNVVIFSSPCVVYEKRKDDKRYRQSRPAFTIDMELCNACSLCVRVLGCPAILVEDEKYLIDPTLCDGCELCERVCQHKAIKVAMEENRVI